MDTEYHLDSEIIETLNILRPPVKRDCKIQKDYNTFSGHEANLVRQFSQLYKVKEQKNSKLSQPSTLSLILQKSREKQIYDKYSSFIDGEISHVRKKQINEKFTNSQTKPTVKIKVIQKKDQNTIIKFLESQNEISKINKNDIKFLSDEKSIAAENVYIIVPGSKEEKIYEIKTRNGFQISKDKCSNIKKLNDKLMALKMEKKRKKLINERKFREDEIPAEICPCNCRNDNLVHDAGSSRVRIFGRIGLDDDDNYVMRCAATVNGQPVSTDYIKPKNNLHLNSLDVEDSIKGIYESQATQVDIGALSKRSPTVDQNIQCNAKEFCHNAYKTENADFDDEYDANNLNGTSSPVVIISVFPKQDFTVNKTTEKISPTRINVYNCRPNQNYLNETTFVNSLYKKTDFHKKRQLSPNKTDMVYPREVDKAEDDKNNTTKVSKNYKTLSRSLSPATRLPKPITIESKKPSTIDRDALKTVNMRNQSPNRLIFNDKKQKDINVLNQNKKKTVFAAKAEVRKQQNTNIRAKSRSHDKNASNVKCEMYVHVHTKVIAADIRNTTNFKEENMAVKNDDVPLHHETFLRKSYPKNDISKVSVNIDSEKEFYNVILEKGKFSTDLTVRKRMKDNSTQKYFEELFEENVEQRLDDDRNSDSLENFFPLEVDGHHRRSVSQTFNAIADDIPLSEHNNYKKSRLYVRDSLELGHRREDGKDLKTKACKLLEYERKNKRKFSAPVKHFNGDTCIVDDPLERDKEIRGLLGIDKKRTDTKTDETQQEAYGNDHCSNCFIRKSISESLVTSEMVKRCFCTSCSKKKMTIGVGESNSTYKEKQIKFTVNKGQNTIEIDASPKLTKHQSKDYRNNEIIRNPVIIVQSTLLGSQENAFKRNHVTPDIVKVVDKQEIKSKQKAIQLTRKQYRKVKKSIRKLSGKRQREKNKLNCFVSVGTIKAKLRREFLIHWDKEVQTDPFTVEILKHINERPTNAGDYHKNTIILFAREKRKNEETRKISSSVEIRFTSIECVNEVACSDTSAESFEPAKRRKHISIETIFRGAKKCHTPNLGASALSLLSEEGKPSDSDAETSDSKPKKPFLKRLISCLVMRSGTSHHKMVPKTTRPEATVNSSVDSYHISTSLGAVEMSSSLYDTSASFYSNNTVGPVNKPKRGFFRGFLATKKS